MSKGLLSWQWCSLHGAMDLKSPGSHIIGFGAIYIDPACSVASLITPWNRVFVGLFLVSAVSLHNMTLWDIFLKCFHIWTICFNFCFQSPDKEWLFCNIRAIYWYWNHRLTVSFKAFKMQCKSSLFLQPIIIYCYNHINSLTVSKKKKKLKSWLKSRLWNTCFQI